MKYLPLIVFTTSVFMFGCQPEVGSKTWCDKMGETPKGEWSANEAGDFTKHCLFKD
jgi:hypothetical protein